MLRSAAARGWSVSHGLELEARHLDDDDARRASPPACRPRSISGVPRLPPTNVGRRCARASSPVSAVVVDLPLVPVIATIGASMNRDGELDLAGDARRPRARAAASSGCRARRATCTIRSAPRNDRGSWPPSSQRRRRAPSSRRAAAQLGAACAVGDGDLRAARAQKLRRPRARSARAPTTSTRCSADAGDDVESIIAPSASPSATSASRTR